MKILWVKSGGFLPLDTGGKIRSYSIARELARRHQVSVFTFYPSTTDDPHDQMRDTFHRVECLPVNLPERASVVDVFTYALNTITAYPYQMRKYCRPHIGRRLREVVREDKYDVLLCDFLLTAGVVPFDTEIPTVIFTHNVEAVIWYRRFLVHRNPLWKAVAWREYRTIERAERRLTGLADHVLTVSDEDRRAFLKFLSAQKVTTVPTGVDPNYFRPQQHPSQTHSLVFTGSMDWSENEDAMIFFCDEILPLIRRRIPDVTLRIVGRRPTKKVLALKEKYPNVQVTGGVDDIRRYVYDSSVYVVPLRVGGGTRIKIFEAMAMGMPIVSTTVGAEGLPVEHDENIVLADDPEKFAERTTALLLNPASRRRLGSAARTLVERHYSWEAVTDIVDETLQRVASRQ
jgi:sugar transferase (PEP-CTERM/EpsH1 system associated)